MISNLIPFVVLSSGSFGRDGWSEGNGPRPNLIWAKSRLDAYKIAKERYWPWKVSVEYLIDTCSFHVKLIEIPNNPWARPRY